MSNSRPEAIVLMRICVNSQLAALQPRALAHRLQRLCAASSSGSCLIPCGDLQIDIFSSV